MIRRTVRFTATARSHLLHLKSWWLETSSRPDILPIDLEEATELLSAFPKIGKPYSKTPVPGVRRLYLGRLTVHLYYTFDDDELLVQALWHARRGSGPDFGISG